MDFATAVVLVAIIALVVPVGTWRVGLTEVLFYQLAVGTFRPKVRMVGGGGGGGGVNA